MSIAEKLQIIAENQQKVYDEGYETGKQAEYDAFWDKYQSNGNRTFYAKGFAGSGWSNITFKPKYDMHPTDAERMFSDCSITDLKGLLEELGIVLDFSNTTYFNYPFDNSQITRVGIIDTSSVSSLNYFLNNSKHLQYIEKFIFKSDGTQTFTSLTFQSCNSLSDVIFEGCVGQSLSVQWCPLNLESAKSLINCLKDYSGTDKDGTYKITFSSTTKTLLEADGNTAPHGGTWLDYVEHKGWTA